jgi:small GTP-binding protein
MGILEKIKDIEDEMAKTQRNKATERSFAALKSRLAMLRTQLLEANSQGGGPGDGFAVKKQGDARIALIGFPSVGKSTLLSTLTDTKSAIAAYEFTTLTCIPGVLKLNGASIQLLDLPGIIEGAANGVGRGREVCAVAKSCDLVMVVLDATQEGQKNHKGILEAELRAVGLRLNESPPQVTFRKKAGGGVVFTSTVPLTKLGDDPKETVFRVLKEYKIHNAEVLFREDCDVDQLIDVIEGNRHYVRCIYVYNKIDQVSLELVDELARRPHTVVIACHTKLNLDGLLNAAWRYLGLVRVYTRKRGERPDLEEPVVLTQARGGLTIKNACAQIHKDLVLNFKFALVWGTSVRFSPQRCGLEQVLHDEDVLQIVIKTAKEERHDKNYGDRAQEHFTKMKNKKKPLQH